MEYKGKLYGKIGNKYFDTSHTSDDWDKLTTDNAKKDAEIKRIDEYCFDLTNHRDSLQAKYTELKQLADEMAKEYSKINANAESLINYQNHTKLSEGVARVG